MNKKLNAIGKGEMDYDYEHDILFFKVKDREYNHSLELSGLVIDLDAEGYPTGIQIFDASKIFQIEKVALQQIQQWKFAIQIHDRVVAVSLFFTTLRRNKVIECRQEIERPIAQPVQNATVECTVLSR